MSFSSRVKDELARLIPEQRLTQKALLSGIVRMSATLVLEGRSRIGFRITTEHPAAARLIFVLFKNCFDLTVQIQYRKNTQLKKTTSFYFSVSPEQGAGEILRDLGILEQDQSGFSLKGSIEEIERAPDEARRAFIRGAFLGAGSLTDPERTYHLEFISQDEEFSQAFSALVNRYGLRSKIIERKGAYVIYLKESENITDILNLMGAHNALFELEDIKIKKQMRNQVNRLVNCETANLSKTVDAAWRQKEAIRYIKKHRGLDFLPDSLKEIASLRLRYEDSSLKELGEQLKPPLGKSGVNHRLKKIEAIAASLQTLSAPKKSAALAKPSAAAGGSLARPPKKRGSSPRYPETEKR